MILEPNQMRIVRINQGGVILSELKSSEFTKIERDILDIIWKLKENQKFFNSERIVKACKSGLNYTEDEIFTNLKNLYKKHILVEGKQLIQTEILKNPVRNLVYKAINEHPGIHLRGLERSLNHPLQTLSWHVVILKKFNFIKSLKFKNKYCFAKIDISDELLLIHTLLRDELNRDIIRLIYRNPKTKIENLSNELNSAPTTIQYHIKDLEHHGIIKNIEDQTGKAFQILNKPLIIKLLKIEAEAKVSPESMIHVVRPEPQIEGDYFKIFIQVKNNWTQTIIKTHTLIDFDDIVLEIEKTKPESKAPNPIIRLREIRKSEKKAAIYWLKAKTCSYTEIKGEVRFEDASGKPHKIDIKPIIIDACFFIRPKLIDRNELNRVINDPNILTSSIQLDFSSGLEDLIDIILTSCSIERVPEESSDVADKIWFSGISSKKDWFILSIWGQKVNTTTKIKLEVFSLASNLIAPILNSLQDSILDYEKRTKKYEEGQSTYIDTILDTIEKENIMPIIGNFNLKKKLLTNELEIIFKCPICNESIFPTLQDSKTDKWTLPFSLFEGVLNQGIERDVRNKKITFEEKRTKLHFLKEIIERNPVIHYSSVDFRYHLEKMYKKGVLARLTFCNKCRKWVCDQCWVDEDLNCNSCSLKELTDIMKGSAGESFE